jgi:acyl-CoA dehydrogenase
MGFEPSTRARGWLTEIAALRERLLPLEAQLLTPGVGFEGVLPALEVERADNRGRGLWAPHLPTAWGGMGLDLVELAWVSEALGRSPLGHYAVNMQAPDVGNAELLLAHGTPEQQARWLTGLAEGSLRSCFTMTEPENAGSNPVMLSTVARRDGDDWVIDGHKWFATAAEGSALAIAMVVTEPDAAPHARASMLLVPTDTPGFVRVRNIPVMGEVGWGWMSHAEVRYEGCRVPADALLGERGGGFALAQVRLGPGRIHHAMRWIGVCERAFDLMCRRAATRMIAPGVPLASRQSVQHAIAECRAKIDASRLMVLDAAERIERHGAKGARVEISTIKFFVAGVLQEVLDHALQVHGALGMTDDALLAFWFRHERAARIYDGPDEVHRNVVARQVLAGYGLKLSER